MKTIFLTLFILNILHHINGTCLKTSEKKETTTSMRTTKKTTIHSNVGLIHPFFLDCDNKVECTGNYYLNYSTCECSCPEGYIEPFYGFCYCGLEECQYKNQIVDKHSCSCVCPNGFGLKGDECVPCDQINCPEIHTQDKSSCECYCSLHNTGCDNGFIPDFENCKCICPDKMVLKDGICVCDISCEYFNNFELNYYYYLEGDCSCECLWGTFLLDDKCVTCEELNITCPENYYLEEYSCSCSCNLEKTGCENGFLPDFENCKCYCPEDVMNVIDGKCVCKINCDETKNLEAVLHYFGNEINPFHLLPWKELLKPTCSCECKDGYYLVDNECNKCILECPEDYILNKKKCSCECNQIPDCFDYRYVNHETCSCGCPEGLRPENKTCVCDLECDSTKNFVAVYTNYYDYATKSFCSCSCKNGTILKNNECVFY